MTKQTEGLCSFCGQNRAFHTNPEVQHEFSADGAALRKQGNNPQRRRGDAPKESAQLGVDPILRALLIKKNLINPQELAEAESEILGILGTRQAVVVRAGEIVGVADVQSGRSPGQDSGSDSQAGDGESS